MTTISEAGDASSDTRPVGRELLRISIELEEGQETLAILEGEDPHDVARRFVERHGLDDEAQEVLEQQIISNLESVVATQETRTPVLVDEILQEFPADADGSYVQPNGEENLEDTSMSNDEMIGEGFD